MRDRAKPARTHIGKVVSGRRPDRQRSHLLPRAPAGRNPPGGKDQQDLGYTLHVRPRRRAEVEAPRVPRTLIHRDAQRPATAAATASPVHDETPISASAQVPVARNYPDQSDQQPQHISDRPVKVRDDPSDAPGLAGAGRGGKGLGRHGASDRALACDARSSAKPLVDRYVPEAMNAARM